MKSLNYFVFCGLVLAVFSSLAGSPSPPLKQLQFQDALQFKIHVESVAHRNVFQVHIVNRSKEFLCLDPDLLSANRGNIRFETSDGDLIRPDSVADRWPKLFFGFDYSVDYLFIRPLESREISIDVPARVRVPGVYGYEIVLPFYLCRDIIDQNRIKKKQLIMTLVPNATGKVTVPNEDHDR